MKWCLAILKSFVVNYTSMQYGMPEDEKLSLVSSSESYNRRIYTENPHKIPDNLITEIPDRSLDDKRLINERALDELLRGPLSLNQLKKRFPGISAVEEIIDDEVEFGFAKKYQEGGRTMYKLTREGIKQRRFWLRYNRPDIFFRHFEG